MSLINTQVPDFEFEIYHNDDLKEVKFEDYKGKWVILMFYPADFTFVCPTELEDMASLHEEILSEGAEIISVSTDTGFCHKAWHDTSPSIGKVNYPMAADPTARLSKAFGVYIEDNGLALRGTFIINPEGLVKAYEIHDLPIGRSAKEALRKLRAAKFVHEYGDQVCPANWVPGADTLKPGLDQVGKI